jgi:hypothetical protein
MRRQVGNLRPFSPKVALSVLTKSPKNRVYNRRRSVQKLPNGIFFHYLKNLLQTRVTKLPEVPRDGQAQACAELR